MICAVEGDRKSGAACYFNTGGGQCACATRLSCDGEFGDINIIGGAIELEETCACDNQRAGGGVIGGTGNSRYGNIANGDAITCEVSSASASRVPVAGCCDVVGSATSRCRTVIVGNLIECSFIGCIERDRKGCRTRDLNVG